MRLFRKLQRRNYVNRSLWAWIAGGAIIGAAAAQIPNAVDSAPEATAVDIPAATSGRVVVRDTETGAFRSPTSEEAAALDQDSNAKSAGAMTVELRPDGSRRLRAGGQIRAAVSAKLTADGKVAVDCVDADADSAQGGAE